MTRLRFLALLVAPALALGLAQGTSQARSLLPSAGRAVNAADYACFWLENSTMTNGCSSMKVLEIPVTMDGEGLWSFTVTAKGATTANNVGCLAIGVDRTGTAFIGPDPRRHLTTFGVVEDLQPTRAWHWGGGGVYVTCEVQPNARVYVVKW